MPAFSDFAMLHLSASSFKVGVELSRGRRMRR